MSGFFGLFSCCFPQKRSSRDDGQGSETESLLGHEHTARNNHDNIGNNNNTQNVERTKTQSIASQDQPGANNGMSGTGRSTPAPVADYGTVTEAHTAALEERRLKVQGIATAMENRMMSINNPHSTLSPHYYQSRRTASAQRDEANELPDSPESSRSRSPVQRTQSSRSKGLVPSAADVSNQAEDGGANQAPSTMAAGATGEGDHAARAVHSSRGRSRSSTTSSFSQGQGGGDQAFTSADGVRRVNLKLGSMWDKGKTMGAKDKKVGTASHVKTPTKSREPPAATDVADQGRPEVNAPVASESAALLVPASQTEQPDSAPLEKISTSGNGKDGSKSKKKKGRGRGRR